MRPRSPGGKALYPGVLSHGGYGLCQACYELRLRRTRGPVRPYHSRETVLEEYDHLTTGLASTRTGIAAQLGITVRALEHHLREARKAGDPRARRVIPR